MRRQESGSEATRLYADDSAVHFTLEESESGLAGALAEGEKVVLENCSAR